MEPWIVRIIAVGRQIFFPFGGWNVLTSYLVKCPHVGCDWFGSLLPRGNGDIFRGHAPAKSTVVFECPRCHGEWHARVVGDDVVPIALQEVTAC
jgi:hypothetical protein